VEESKVVLSFADKGEERVERSGVAPSSNMP